MKRTTTIQKSILLALACLFFATGIFAQQAKLSFQGTLKKSNGIAVDDGEYPMTFKIYTQETGGTAIWTETQNQVMVSGGIYSVFLGDETALDIPFDQVYYLGVKVGGAPELQPRFRLTSAPYALSLIGQTNSFPSSGSVKADGMIISGKVNVGGDALPTTSQLEVKGGIVAEGGAPGVNGADNNGYGFKGNNGDDDSGLYSEGEGEVSVFVNNAEKIEVKESNVTVKSNQAVNGELTVGTAGIPGNVNLSKGGGITYNGIKDWILVDEDRFLNGSLDGWSITGAGTLHPHKIFQIIPGSHNNPYTQGDVVSPTANAKMVKTFNLGGIPHSQVKVKFTVIAWGADHWDDEAIFAGFGNPPAIITEDGPNNARFYMKRFFAHYQPTRVEMVIDQYTADNIPVYIWGWVNEAGERIAVANVEVYVK